MPGAICTQLTKQTQHHRIFPDSNRSREDLRANCTIQTNTANTGTRQKIPCTIDPSPPARTASLVSAPTAVQDRVRLGGALCVTRPGMRIPVCCCVCMYVLYYTVYTVPLSIAIRVFHASARLARYLHTLAYARPSINRACWVRRTRPYIPGRGGGGGPMELRESGGDGPPILHTRVGREMD